MKIGKLKRVPLREIWKHEEYDFSSWLANMDNLEILSQEIGIEIIEPQTETGVGGFSADIVALESGSERKILIENQLEASNHDHLGKLFTYGAGIDAEIIIWIVKVAREEHEQAINWLNEHTDEKINLFLLQIEAWQIGDSDAAPKFNIIAKPNDWAKLVKQSSRERAVTDYKLLQQAFWEGLQEADVNGVCGSRKASPRHWYDVSIGSSNAHIALTLNKTDNTVNCELYVPKDDEKVIFDKLQTGKDKINAQLNMPVEWMRLDGKRASRIRASFPADIEDESVWPACYEWLIGTTAQFKKTFSRRI